MRRTSQPAARWGLPALLVISCATAGPDPLVVEARTEVERIQNAPGVRENASVQVYEAQQQLAGLELAARRDANRDELQHLAYLTRRRVEIAEVTAEQKQLQGHLETLADTRDHLRLEARELEAVSARARARTAEERLRELEEELKAARTDRGLVLTLSDVLFAFDRSDLAPGAERTIERVAEFLEDYPDRKVHIEGHTDSLGDQTYNLRLSKRRAEAVARHLALRGIGPERAIVRGLGESMPVASNTTEAGRQQNRRVEIVIPD